jgi:hypothetical protein
MNPVRMEVVFAKTNRYISNDRRTLIAAPPQALKFNG